MRRFYALLLTLAPFSFGQDSSTLFTGTAINNTDPTSPIAAPMTIRLIGTSCTITISLPLIGSGQCLLTTYEEKSGRLEIVSAGSATNITWSGTVKGNFASGSYKVGGGTQTGTFYLAILKEPAGTTAAAPQPARRPTASPQSSCVPTIESAITGEVHGWSGDTIFKLDNGQIWQQAEYDYTYFYEYHPDVTIYQTSSGCKMKVEDEDETIIVKRIK